MDLVVVLSDLLLDVVPNKFLTAEVPMELGNTSAIMSGARLFGS
jgi:hypothetical protein